MRTVRWVALPLNKAEASEVVHQACQAQVCRKNIQNYVGRHSVVGVATKSGLDGPGTESRWGEIFRTHSDRLWGPHNRLYNA